MIITVIKPAQREKDANGDYVETVPASSIDYEVDERDIQPMKRHQMSTSVEVDESGVLVHNWLIWFDKLRADVQVKDTVEINSDQYIVSGIDRFRRHKEVFLHGME